MKKDWKKYIYAFLITSVIFATAAFLGNYFSDKKLEALKATENQISVDILSSETQFAILGEASCADAENSTLSQELDSLGDKLNYSQENFGADNADFIGLKKYYSLLEIKNYLLLKKLTDCPKPPIIILYFYSSNCPDCDKEGYVLTDLKDRYPDLLVYSFDYNLDVSALKTLADVHGVGKTLPALIIKNKLYSGFQTADDIKALLPELVEASTTNVLPNK